jgi:Kef-type K+ transport system membrane component KefB
MLATLSLLLVVSAAYLLAHFVVDRLENKFFFSSGGEYLLLGILVGPAFPWFTALSGDVLAQLAPLMSLAIGWMGLLYGTRIQFPTIAGSRFTAGRIALIEAVITGAIVAGIASIAFHFLPFSWEGSTQWAFALATLSVASIVASPYTVKLVKRKLNAKGETTNLLEKAFHINELVAIVAFGAILCLFHTPNPTFDGRPTWIEWFVITIALGAFLGVLFGMFLGDEHDEDKQFLALVGIVVFASGLAYSLELSPLLVNLVLGVVLVRVADPQLVQEIDQALERSSRPMYIVMLIFAGAMTTVAGWLPWALAGIFVIARTIGKLTGGAIASIVLPCTRLDQGRGMLGHGDVAVAMALNILLVYPGELGKMLSAAILASVFLNEFWSSRLLKGLLIDTGDIRHDSEITSSVNSEPQPPPFTELGA